MIRVFDFPDDLDAYLRTAEARFPDVLPEQEKTIVWADPVQKHKTPLAVVYIHGFSACRQETAPLAEIVARSLGANLFYTRLTGHGRPPHALAEATVNDWLNDAVEALEIGRKLGKQVIIIATSTGATLATWLATSTHTQEVVAYVFISPNYLPANRGAWLLTLPCAGYFVPLLYGKIWRWTPVNELHGQYWTQDYPITANMTVMKLVKSVRHLDVSAIRQPVLVVFSSLDKIVKPTETERFFKRFGSTIKHKIIIDDSQDPRHHVIAGDILSPNTTAKIADAIVAFVKNCR